MDDRRVTKDAWAMRQPHGWQQLQVGDVLDTCTEGRGGTWMAFNCGEANFHMNFDEFWRCTQDANAAAE